MKSNKSHPTPLNHTPFKATRPLPSKNTCPIQIKVANPSPTANHNPIKLIPQLSIDKSLKIVVDPNPVVVLRSPTVLSTHRLGFLTVRLFFEYSPLVISLLMIW